MLRDRDQQEVEEEALVVGRLVAREQEMRALVEENRAKVVEAEAQVPQAISEAFRSGHMGVMDYYNMRNVQSDTSMRNNIASMTGGNENQQGRGNG